VTANDLLAIDACDDAGSTHVGTVLYGLRSIGDLPPIYLPVITASVDVGIRFHKSTFVVLVSACLLFSKPTINPSSK